MNTKENKPTRGECLAFIFFVHLIGIVVFIALAMLTANWSRYLWIVLYLVVEEIILFLVTVKVLEKEEKGEGR